MRKLVLAGAAALLCGCQSISDYMDRKTDYRSSGPARTLPPLEVPPDLTSPERDGRYVVPEQQTAKSSTTFSSEPSSICPWAMAIRASGTRSRRWAATCSMSCTRLCT